MIETDDDDRKRVARDGERIRVPLLMCDSTQRAVAGGSARDRYVERLQDAHKRDHAGVTAYQLNPELRAFARSGEDESARQRYIAAIEAAHQQPPQIPAPTSTVYTVALDPRSIPWALPAWARNSVNEIEPTGDAAPRGRDAYLHRITNAWRSPV